MSNLVKCKSCEKEVAKSAAQCPHCGVKLKSGCFVQTLKFGFIGLAVLIGLNIATSDSPEERLAKEKAKVATIINSKSADISPTELGEIFNMGSKASTIQKDSTKKELKGKIVTWELQVYNVRKSGSDYRIQTKSGSNVFGSRSPVGTFLDVDTALSAHADEGYYKGKELDDYVATLSEGSYIKVKGEITGTTMGSIDLEPAFLLK